MKFDFYMNINVGSLGKIKFLNVLLWVRKVRFIVVVLNIVNERLNVEMVKYFLRWVDVKMFIIFIGI